jgi:trans-2,3-dihydro-3-hydroxyanthranilate isomerase
MTPSTLPYLHFDVFTGARFEGNQLAVFLDVPEIPPELMQRIAAEMAFSESTFVFPAEGPGDVRMRIFTPGEELPMAGHPTNGTTFALAQEGRIPHGRETFVFELGIGPTEVALEWNAGGLSFAWMTQLVPTFGPAASNPAAFLASAGIDPADVHPGLPAQVVSCGLPFLFLPLRTRDAVDAVQVDRRALTRAFDDAGIDEVPLFVFTTEQDAGDETAYSRMLAPGFGISEDPATGSASGPLGCYMLQHGMITAAEAQRVVSLQGVAMGRPSRIHVSIDSDKGRITRVRVGGEAVLVGRGEILVS